MANVGQYNVYRHVKPAEVVTVEAYHLPPPDPPEWCRCGCGGEGRCMRSCSTRDERDEPGAATRFERDGILAMIRAPLR